MVKTRAIRLDKADRLHTQKGKRGFVALPENEKRSKMLTLLVTPLEAELINEYAEKLNMGMGEMIRFAVYQAMLADGFYNTKLRVEAEKMNKAQVSIGFDEYTVNGK